jgi:hypothetical protein
MPPPPPYQPQQPSAFLSTVLNNHNIPHAPSSHATTTPPRPTPRPYAAPPTFNATQRSLQARGKEYNIVGRKEEGYEARQKREEASRILESTEMLIWWSAARNEVRFFVLSQVLAYHLCLHITTRFVDYLEDGINFQRSLDANWGVWCRVYRKRATILQI